MIDRATHAAGTFRLGDEAPGFAVGPITRTHIVRYAGASGDFTAIHHDEPLAHSVGLPSVFAMGMMHAGMLAHLVADWLGLASVRRYRVRFEERVWPGDVLTFAGRIIVVDRSDGVERVEAEVTCHNQGGKRTLSGSATAEYPL
ncbi:MaoC/PaaZ C-terminal domain-containing protein [Mycobacterium xenopi]|uniref:MaoC-like dehydratase n=2 Tax=Mycobacterium xenopi TaxID=1789 RepID=A0AAD1M3G3_MYCXE|nr:MaoC/PaaZ C-terminal domain-containing protein [Mycobacterium xenopi]MDA3642316.1 MaoC/PaaZ C-terminal domain-containing protein [Mycobacterium xenopi]MDA3660143.1 MaoC/PaaZ C-terminal domain-containing protein [Mycobacterium xenopi]MDA3664955.1 MaoC/PaaZ C-terminal domain-containing protein [Mycobacterium xenopi]ORX19561.1 hypothetical protein AWC32_10185 [Mycobacterium xenopi]SPX90230.1 MaoC-like dehydratase [Mycobacterium xenopi]